MYATSTLHCHHSKVTLDYDISRNIRHIAYTGTKSVSRRYSVITVYVAPK